MNQYREAVTERELRRDAEAARHRKRKRRDLMIMSVQVMLLLYIVASIVSIPVVVIAYVWGMDIRWVQTFLVNGVVALVIAMMIAAAS